MKQKILISVVCGIALVLQGCGGGGGGSPTLALAGGKDPSGLAAALKRVEELLISRDARR